MSDTEITVIEKPKRQKSITQQDLDNFKDGILSLLDERLDAFVDDFLEAWQESNNTDNTESCDCPECTGNEKGEFKEFPARYILFSGGQQFPATDVKPNPIMGVDFYFREVDSAGKEHNSKGTITSADVVIVDLQPELTLEAFSAIKNQTLEYVIQQAQEAKVKQEAMKAVQGQVIDNSSHVSYG